MINTLLAKPRKIMKNLLLTECTGHGGGIRQMYSKLEYELSGVFIPGRILKVAIGYLICT